VRRRDAQQAALVDEEARAFYTPRAVVWPLVPWEHVVEHDVLAGDGSGVEEREELALHLDPRSTDLRAHPAIGWRELVVEKALNGRAHRKRDVWSGHVLADS
jgi:hypothetical protein